MRLPPLDSANRQFDRSARSMDEKIDNAGSGTLEAAFANGADRPKKTFYFHHVPKTAGTSLRHALRRHFVSPANVFFVRHIGKKLSRTSTEEAARGLEFYLAPFWERFGLFYVASHFTAPLAWTRDDVTIYTLVRDPERHLRSFVSFKARHFARVVDKRGLDDAVAKLWNVQGQSLLAHAAPIPPQPKRDGHVPPEAEKLVDDIRRRFRVFRTDRYGDFLRSVERDLGLRIEEAQKKTGSYDEEQEVTDLLVDEVLSGRRGDPLWFDRLLYEKVA